LAGYDQLAADAARCATVALAEASVALDALGAMLGTVLPSDALAQR
jgi:hypothetical protein